MQVNIAAAYGRHEAMLELCEAGCDVNIPDKHGVAPLYKLLSTAGNGERVHRLVRYAHSFVFFPSGCHLHSLLTFSNVLCAGWMLLLLTNIGGRATTSNIEVGQTTWRDKRSGTQRSRSLHLASGIVFLQS